MATATANPASTEPKQRGRKKAEAQPVTDEKVQAFFNALPQSVHAAVQSGDIELGQVPFKIGKSVDGNTTGADIETFRPVVTVKNRNGALALFEGDDAQIWDAVSSQINASFASEHRDNILSGSTDPRMAGIIKTARLMVKQGMFAEESEAVSFLDNQLKAQGK